MAITRFPAKPGSELKRTTMPTTLKLDQKTADGQATAPAPQPTLKDLFSQRDSTRPGSKEEDQVVEKIIEAIFPE